MKNQLLLIAGLLALVACRTTDVNPQLQFRADCPFCGTWVYANWVYQSSGGFTTYGRRANLVENQYGLIFRNDGTVTERKNSGWCATPPSNAADYAGTWEQRGDTLYIASTYWGGKETYRFTYTLSGADSLRLKSY